MKIQEFYDDYVKTKEEIKELYEKQDSLITKFKELYETETEYPVIVDGKDKYIRLGKVDGKFVYNTEYEVGIRVTPKNQIGESL